MDLTVIILAAGEGKRMVSDLPKVLHCIGGQPLLAHVLRTAGELKPTSCAVVYGHGGEQVQATFAKQTGVAWVQQAEQLGTGHAVAQALQRIDDTGAVLILYGDVPLVDVESLRRLAESARSGRLGLLTVELYEPTGYGRIIRDAAGRVIRSVEEMDASPEERLIREVNTGIVAAPMAHLRRWVASIGNANAQGEYYLTDMIEMAAREGIEIEAFVVDEPREVQGVNDRLQLAALERYYQRRQADRLLLDGVTLLDPARVDVRGLLQVGRDVVIDVNVIFEGRVTLGDRVRIGPHTVIRNTIIDSDTEVLAHCYLEEARIGRWVQIGPFSRLRPDAVLADKAKVGNFVEVKKSVIGEGSKVSHLTYIGDAEIGEGVNVGAGTIICNYDGANKHRTIIEDGAFIGSNTALVAPVRVGEGATVGAGSAIGKNVPAGSLALTRAPQTTKRDWSRPIKKST